MEIVTWVLDGALVHQDSQGHSGVIYPGLAQRMTAGTGILHSEKNDSWRLTGEPEHRDPVHFVQMWVPPDARALEPGYEQLEIADADLRGRLAVVASGMDRDRDRGRDPHPAAVRLAAGRTARRRRRRPAAGGTVRAPVRRAGRGRRWRAAGRLGTGDAARVTHADGQRVSAVDGPAEVLVWEMHGRLA